VKSLNITIGLPGSGKTTDAKRWVGDDPLRRTRLNRDDLRVMMFGSRTGLVEHEDAVTVAQEAALRALLAGGGSVVVDDTNLRPDVVERLSRIGWDAGANVGIWDRTNVPVEECIDRDCVRAAMGEPYVGETAIRQLHAEWRALNFCAGCGEEIHRGTPPYPGDIEGNGRLCTACTRATGADLEDLVPCGLCRGKPLFERAEMNDHRRLAHAGAE